MPSSLVHARRAMSKISVHDDRRQAERGLVEQQQLRPRHQRAARARASAARRRRACPPAGDGARRAGGRTPKHALASSVDVRRGACRRRAAGSPRRVSSRRCRGPRGRGRSRRARSPPATARRCACRRRRRRRVRRTVPEIARSVVVLPAPFAPSTRDDLALADGERHAVQRLDRAVARLDVLELEQQRSRLGSRGTPRSRRGPPAPRRASPRRSSCRSRARARGRRRPSRGPCGARRAGSSARSRRAAGG